MLKAVLDHAFALGYISENPAHKAALLVKRKVNPSKQQHLSEIYDDLSKFMTAFLSAPVSNVMRDWMVFCLTTGLRKRESMSVKWEQVDLVQKRVTLPTNKSDSFLIVPMVGLTYGGSGRDQGPCLLSAPAPCTGRRARPSASMRAQASPSPLP